MLLKTFKKIRDEQIRDKQNRDKQGLPVQVSREYNGGEESIFIVCIGPWAALQGIK